MHELGKENLSVVKKWAETSVTKTVSPCKRYHPSKFGKSSITEAEISKQARIATAELVPNTEICEASPSKNVLPEKGPSILSRQLNDHQTQFPVNELSQGITNSSTIANEIPK